MPVYEYTALDRAGKSTRGIVDADSPQAARQKLRGSGVYPVDVRESSAVKDDSPARSISVSSIFSRVRSAEVTVIVISVLLLSLLFTYIGCRRLLRREPMEMLYHD